MDKPVVTDEILLNAGYQQFKPAPLDNDGIECHFQKRFEDEHGKKYFITVDKWKPMRHPTTDVEFPAGYEYELYLSDKETDKPVRILLYCGWTLEEVEKRAEEFWQMGCWRYYETWDEC